MVKNVVGETPTTGRRRGRCLTDRNMGKEIFIFRQLLSNNVNALL